ncbi:MAG TPA: metallophosphoesterase [Sphingobium sp.]|nr:metallophosphoesterase [Sphingobium sp.]
MTGALAIILLALSPLTGANAAGTPAKTSAPATGPVPLAEWPLELDNALPRRAGPAGTQDHVPMPSVSEAGTPRIFAQLKETDRRDLPVTTGSGPFTAELWILDHVNQRVGALLDGGSAAQGDWALGYVSGQALFGPIGRDGVPALKVQTGEGFKERWHHLVGVWNGRQWTLYVDGIKQAEMAASSAVRPTASLLLSGYFDNERFMRLPHLVKSVAVYDKALDASEVKAAFAHRARLVEDGRLTDKALHFTQPPYLNAPTTSSIELSWETDHPIAATVEWGETADTLKQRRFLLGRDRLGGLTLDGLRADTPYFYRVSGVDSAGNPIDSGLLSFRSAPLPGAPFTMAISADTEARPHINSRMSALIWEERPNLLLLAGDLTDGGSENTRFEWTHEYFAGMGPLFGRVPVIAAPGNGESELHWFRHYHRQPGDEAFFSHRYGDAEIFVLDSNLEDREQREPGFRARQKAWLEQALAASTAKWKIAMHHHALMSTDDDDYGDSWTGKSRGGDPVTATEFQPLFEKYGVDLVFVGHLHAYERSWPIRDGKVDRNGVTYVQLGGMGGNLEDFQPTKPWFNRKAFRDHHFLMLRGAGDRLEAEVIDADGHRRDAFVLTRQP